MTQSTDAQLSCAEIAEQISGNEDEGMKLLQKINGDEQTTGVKIAASLVFAPLYVYQLNFSHEDQIRMRSLADRDEVLKRLRTQKGCLK